MVAIIVPGRYGPMIVGGTAAGGGGFSLTWTAVGVDLVGGTTVSFGSLSIGAANANRVVAVAICDRSTGGSNPLVSSVSIGGNAASQVSGAQATDPSTFTHSDVWYLAVAAGTTATVTVTYNNSSIRSIVEVYSVITTTPTPVGGSAANAAGNSLTASSVTIPSGGGALAIYGARGPGNSTDITWTNATKDDTQLNLGATPGNTFGAAHTTSTGSVAVGATIAAAANSNVAISVAAWGP